jgi:hypothetical protein
VAVFKILKGKRAALNQKEKTDGYCYFTTDDGLLHIDWVGPDEDGNNVLKRTILNANDAKSLTGATLETNRISPAIEGGREKIPSSSIVAEKFKNKLNIKDPAAIGTVTVSKESGEEEGGDIVAENNITAGENVTAKFVNILDSVSDENHAIPRKYFSNNIPRLFTAYQSAAANKTSFDFSEWFGEDTGRSLTDPYYLIFFNGLLLSKLVHYTISPDGTKVILNGWSANDSQDVVQIVGFVPSEPDSNIWG